MRTALAVVACVACGSSPAPAPAPPSQPPGATRDELVAATLVALSAGDRDALDRLGADRVDAIVACADPERQRELRDHLRKRAADVVAELGGGRLELVGVDDDKVIQRVRAGAMIGPRGCTAHVAFEAHALELRVVARGRSEHVRLHVLRVGDRWQLGEVPKRAYASEMEEMRDRVCACTDIPCADAVMKEFARRFKDAPTKQPSEADMQLAKELTECMQKIYAPSAGSGTP